MFKKLNSQADSENLQHFSLQQIIKTHKHCGT